MRIAFNTLHAIRSRRFRLNQNFARLFFSRAHRFFHHSSYIRLLSSFIAFTSVLALPSLAQHTCDTQDTSNSLRHLLIQNPARDSYLHALIIGWKKVGNCSCNRCTSEIRKTSRHSTVERKPKENPCKCVDDAGKWVTTDLFQFVEYIIK